VVQPFPAPTFGHTAEAFVIAHASPGAWSKGTAVKYRQTLSALDARLAESAPTAAADVAVLGTPAGASALEIAFTAAYCTTTVVQLVLCIFGGVSGAGFRACGGSRGSVRPHARGEAVRAPSRASG
jgi:hypothetical protein